MDQSTSIKPSILVIDDSLEILDVFKIGFEREGYKIITKTSAADINKFVQNYKIDILVLDVILDGIISGRHICKELKSNPATNYFPIILISASPNCLYDFRECDADGFIEKPFDLGGVIKKINSLMKIVD